MEMSKALNPKRYIDKMLHHLARTMNRIAVLSSVCFPPPPPPDLNIGFGPGWSKQLGGATFCREPPGGPAALRHAPNIKIGGKGGERAMQYRCQCWAKVVQHFVDVRYVGPSVTCVLWHSVVVPQGWWNVSLVVGLLRTLGSKIV